MKKLLSTLIILCLVGAVMAQGDYEAFRFSQFEYQGTARYMGAGGAFGATGGEFSAISTNPAAIGLYKRSEVSFTPMLLSFSKNNTLYYGSSCYTQNPKYTVPQCGLVIASNIEGSPWKAWQFGFGYNRIMDFNNTFRANATVHNTMMNTIIDHIDGTLYSNLSGDGELAWNTWMVDTLAGLSNFYGTPFANADIDQEGIVKTSGGIDEMSVTFGGNYDDKLFIGASIGIPILDYTERIQYTETATDEATLSRGIRSFETNTTQHNTSGGINLKLGLIYQPVSFLRIGAGFQTPTYYWKVKDTYYRDMISYYTDGRKSDLFSYDNYYKFSLTTPLKFNVDASFLINKRAFISAEYEFTDYSLAKLYANDYSFTDENERIISKYGIAHTLRIGAEVNLGPKFVIRGGYNYKTSPYKLVDNQYNASAHYGSIGFGFRTRYFFFDMAYVMRFMKDSYWMYDTDDNSNVVQNSNTTHRIVATVGCKF